MSNFINHIDVHLRHRFNTAVLIVHHTGNSDNHRARGASALRAAMDHEYRLDFGNGVRSLVCTKAKESEPSLTINFLLEQVALDGWTSDDGEVVTSAVMVRTDATTGKKKGQGLSKNARKVLIAMKRAIELHGIVPDTTVAARIDGPVPERVVHIDHWKKCAIEDGLSNGKPDAQRKALSRVTKEIESKNAVSKVGDFYWIN